MKKFGWGNLQISNNSNNGGNGSVTPGVDEKAVNSLIDNKLNPVVDNLNNLGGSVDILTGDVEKLSRDQSTTDESIRTIQGSLEDIKDKNNTLNNNITNNSSNIDTLGKYIGKDSATIRKEYLDPVTGQLNIPTEKTIESRLSQLNMDMQNAEEVISVKSLDEVKNPRPGVLYLIDKPSNPGDLGFNGSTDTSYHWVPDDYSPKGGHWDVIASSMLVVDEQGNTIQATSATHDEISKVINKI